MVSESAKLAQTEYKGSRDNVARYIHWQLCGKCGLERVNNRYHQKSKGVMESENFKIFQDISNLGCKLLVLHTSSDTYIAFSHACTIELISDMMTYSPVIFILDDVLARVQCLQVQIEACNQKNFIV